MNSSFEKRTGIVLSFLLAWAVITAAHVFFYTVIARDSLLAESHKIAWREGDLPALRGRILDPNLNVLARDETQFSLIFRTEPSSEARKKIILDEVSAACPRAAGKLPEKLTAAEASALKRIAAKYPELGFEMKTMRRRSDLVSGERLKSLEELYNPVLAGKNGRFAVMLDRTGRWLPGSLKVLREPIHGRDVIVGNAGTEAPK